MKFTKKSNIDTYSKERYTNLISNFAKCITHSMVFLYFDKLFEQTKI